jgi:uncharacterized coiled-coil DUF342 family protein
LRKRTVILAAAVVAAGLAATLIVIFVTGDNPGENKARAYLNDAYAKSKEVAEKQVEVEEKGEELLGYINTASDLTPEVIQEAEQLFDELVALVAASNAAAEKTRVEYEKVLQLEDLEDFKAYARNKIEVLDLTSREADLMEQFYGVLKRVFEEARSGGTPDETAVMNELKSITEKRDQVRAEIEKLNQEAADMSEKLNIE